MEIGRFAPSPSGRMHLGNVFAALMSWLSVRAAGGELLLRIEDLDPERSRQEYCEALMEDLEWLGLNWDRRAPDQSQRRHAYDAALECLQKQNRIYPCYCTRNQLHAVNAPHAADGRVIYPGTCRNLTPGQRLAKTRTPCLRLQVPFRQISFFDGLQGEQTMDLGEDWGDCILRRSDGVAAYQLAVVVDDGEQEVTQVVRGRDLLSSTHVQLYLYELLNLKPPRYYHVPLLLAPDGRRLSKRDRDLDLGEMKKRYPPDAVVGYLGWKCGILPKWEAAMPGDLLQFFSWDRIIPEDIVIDPREFQYERIR